MWLIPVRSTGGDCIEPLFGWIDPFSPKYTGQRMPAWHATFCPRDAARTMFRHLTCCMYDRGLISVARRHVRKILLYSKQLIKDPRLPSRLRRILLNWTQTPFWKLWDLSMMTMANWTSESQKVHITKTYEPHTELTKNIKRNKAKVHGSSKETDLIDCCAGQHLGSTLTCITVDCGTQPIWPPHTTVGLQQEVD